MLLCKNRLRPQKNDELKRKNFLKRFSLKTIVLIAFAVALLLLVFRCGYYYFKYMRIREIHLSSFNGREGLRIPVRFCDGNLTAIRGVAVYTPEGVCYTLRCIPERKSVWLTINRVAWGGLTVFSARYEALIDDKFLCVVSTDIKKL